jgi:hypothetical protein
MNLHLIFALFLVLVLLVVLEQRGLIDLDRRWRELRSRHYESPPDMIPSWGPYPDGRATISLFGTFFRLVRYVVLELVYLTATAFYRRPIQDVVGHSNVIPLRRRRAR